MLLKVLQVKGSFNPELQLKDTKPAIRNKLKNIVELRGFKFVTTLVLVFKRQKAKIKQNLTIVIQAQKQNELSIKVTLKMCLN